MRIVITGGAGFVGEHLLDWLVERGHEALVIDDFSMAPSASKVLVNA